MRNRNTIEERSLRNLIRPVRLLPVVLGVVLSPAIVAEPGTGSLQGRVNFGGGKAPQGIVVADTVVYLTGDGLAGRRVRPSIPAVLDQRDITFVPHVLPVLAGVKVEVRNSDAILHTVHTTSQKNPFFDLPQLGNRSMEVAFDFPEVIHVGCDVHSQMSAYIVVVPTPYFTKAAGDGSFTLTDIPPGRYRLVAWHEKYQAAETEIEIGAGQPATAEVNLTPTPSATKS